ncbi:MAG: AAA family ATPase [Planctomycetota bacterium]
MKANEVQDSIPAPIESDRAGNELWTPVPITELKDVPPIDWLWEGYIARSKITELVGIWKSGKTTLVAHLLRETAYGGELVGKGVDNAKVLIISEEDSSEWKDRKEEYGLGGNIDLICIPFKTKPSGKEWQAFVKHIDELVSSYDLIVIDTIATNWPVRDENSNSEVIEAMMPLRQWTEQGACVLIIHHSRKGDGQEGQASRGAGGLPAFVDIILEFRRHDPSREDDTRRTIKGYSRHKETPKEVVIELTDDRYVLLGNKSEATASKRLSILESLIPLDGPPGSTVEEVMANWTGGLRPGERTLRSDLETLHSKGKIERSGDGKKGSPYNYYHYSKNPFLADPHPIGQETNTGT